MKRLLVSGKTVAGAITGVFLVSSRSTVFLHQYEKPNAFYGMPEHYRGFGSTSYRKKGKTAGRQQEIDP